MPQEQTIDRGYVYILINASMPGLVKIGQTIRSPSERAIEISQGTGIPTPYTVAWDEVVFKCEEAEKIIHARLDEYRVRNNREFFSIPLKKAIQIVTEVAREFQEIERIEAEKLSAETEAAKKERAKQIEAARNAANEVQTANYKKSEADWERTRFRSVKGIMTKCPNCQTPYSVTLRRYEDRTACPKCGRFNLIDIEW